MSLVVFAILLMIAISISSIAAPSAPNGTALCTQILPCNGRFTTPIGWWVKYRAQQWHEALLQTMYLSSFKNRIFSRWKCFSIATSAYSLVFSLAFAPVERNHLIRWSAFWISSNRRSHKLDPSKVGNTRRIKTRKPSSNVNLVALHRKDCVERTMAWRMTGLNRLRHNQCNFSADTVHLVT